MFLGKGLAVFAKELKEYALAHGESPVLPFFHTMSMTEGENGSIRLCRSTASVNRDDNPLETQVSEGVPEIISGDNSEANLKNHFAQLFADIITIDTPGDTSTLLVTAYIPAYNESCRAMLEKVLNALRLTGQNYECDVICLLEDLDKAIASPTEPTEQHNSELLSDAQKATLQWLTQVNRDCERRIVSHIIPIQNTNSDGFSIGLNHDSLLRLLGEFALQCTENYYGLFPPNFDPEHEITALGLSVLHLDREYFVKYLMRRTFLQVLDRENVTQSEVDINKIEPIAQKCIKDPDLSRDFTRAFGKFWDDEVKPLLEKNKTHQEIIATVSPKAEDLFTTEMPEALQAYLPDESLSLPERRCVLALILGQDDNQLTNNIFSQEQCTIDDIVEQPLSVFVNEYNLHKGEEGELHSALDTPKDESGNVIVPIAVLRKVRDKMRDSTQYMRQLGSQIADLSKQIDLSNDSTLRLTEKGFTFDGTTYKLIKGQTEQAFEETYSGRDNTPPTMDLRSGFTAIRDQGTQGSCAAFAVVSVFEYMLKTGGEKITSNLSEAFVYYNVRKKDDKQMEDSGSSVYDTINAIHDLGVCTEELCPYLETDYTTEPTQPAYVDALQRTIATAKSITLTGDTDRNVRDIKSALADGYPVIVSLRICNSFNATKGFVKKPSAEEILQESQGSHAMVVCGYSDKEKFFIVRNSWGTKFGDHGYCYIPYSYIEDPNLNMAAFIVTEVNVGSATKTITAPEAAKIAVNFDTTDATIAHAVASNLLDEEQKHFSRTERYYKSLQTSYQTLLTKLQNNSLRRSISEAAKDRLSNAIADCELHIAELQANLTKELALFDSVTKQWTWYSIWFLIVLTLVFYILYYKADITGSIFTTVAAGVWAITLILLLLWIPYRKSQRQQLINRYKVLIAMETDNKTHLKAEITTSDMRFHIAGIFIDKFVKLQSELMGKYYAMRALTGNLATWHDEEQNKISTMDAFTREPFIPVLDNASLDRFFDEQGSRFTEPIRLYRYIHDFEVNAGGIMALQAKLRKSVAEQLRNLLSDFTMFGYLNDTARYPYLNPNRESIDVLLPKLKDKSRPFVRYKQLTDQTAEIHAIKIFTANQNEQRMWEHIYPQHFSIRPESHMTLTPFRLIFTTVKPLQISDLFVMK